MGLIDLDKIWRGKWIMDADFHGLLPINLFHKELEEFEQPEHREDLKNHHMLIRKKFVIDQSFQRAKIDITADDYYKLSINGKFVGQGPAPAYYFNYYYNSYDISDLLKQGENVIAVHLYYQGLVNRVWNSGDYRQGMIAELFVDERLLLATDSNWKYKITKAYKSGGITGYKTQYLENIDFNLLEKGWKGINYNDSDWERVFVHYSDDHKLYLQPTPSVEIYEKEARLIKKLAEGHYLIDFGQEITGQYIMELEGKRGEVIEIRHGEELLADNENRVRYNMRSNCKYQEYLTLSGGKDELEFFDYKAFRYVEIKTLVKNSSALKNKSFKALVRHYPFDDKHTQFESSSQLLNDIWRICKNSVKYGVQEGCLDCPGREKGQYLGDTVITGVSHFYLTGDLRLYKKAIQDFALSSHISAGLMAVAPGGFMQEIADYSLQWPSFLLRYYQFSADQEFLSEMYPIVEKLLEYFKRFQREDGLLEDVSEKWNLVDWPEEFRDDYDFPLTRSASRGCHNLINALFLGMVKTINQLRDILGVEYENRFGKLKSAFIKSFYNKKKKLFVDAEGSLHSSLHANVLPLLYDLIPEEKEDIEDTIVNLIRKKRFSCGVYMAYYVLKALSKAGEYSLIVDLLLSEDKHSWGNMIKEGASTCFEVWGKEQKWNTSLCHPWASAPVIVIIEDLIGLKLSWADRQKIEFEPHISDEVKKINFKIKTDSGEIEFEYKNGRHKAKFP
ncbi:MAG: alpha-L-rhamnosidase [Firmicutes bacterium]|nr:alpha-L-rhamnosidase [Bacillota bacterium]